MESAHIVAIIMLSFVVLIVAIVAWRDSKRTLTIQPTSGAGVMCRGYSRAEALELFARCQAASGGEKGKAPEEDLMQTLLKNARNN